VIAEAHPDSTDSAWQSIDVAAATPLPTPVSLARAQKLAPPGSHDACCIPHRIHVYR
jgi:hypothetical protein